MIYNLSSTTSPGVYSLSEALRMAEELELDLVEISPNVDPPVCKIIDYQKYVYQQKKKAKEMKANASKVVIKEIRFGPNTDEHDFQFKLKHAQSFLEEGFKVKSFVFFKGHTTATEQRRCIAYADSIPTARTIISLLSATVTATSRCLHSQTRATIAYSDARQTRTTPTHHTFPA
jgi:translation initiation factor IF-3